MSTVTDRWTRRLRIRRRLEAAARRRYIWHPTAENLRILKGRREQIAAALRVLRRHRDRPPLIVRLPVQVDGVFGPLGTVRYVTGHHTAGPRDTTCQHAVDLLTGYHGEHRAKGWGGIGYHFALAADGTLILCRPAGLKGAHVGGWNTGNIGVVCCGTTGDEPTSAQRRTYRWLLRNAHTRRLPASHRVDLRSVARHGHKDWAGHESNACPGTFHTMYLNG